MLKNIHACRFVFILLPLALTNLVNQKHKFKRISVIASSNEQQENKFSVIIMLFSIA
jgi:hypothetical protein